MEDSLADPRVLFDGREGVAPRPHLEQSAPMRSLPWFILLAACGEPTSPPPAPAKPPAAAPASSTVAADALPSGRRSPTAERPPAHVRIELTTSEVWLDLGPAWDALPEAERPGMATQRPDVRLVDTWPPGEAPPPNLAAALSAAAAHLPADRAVVIRAAADVPYGQVARALAAASLAGYKRWLVETKEGLLPLQEARPCIQPATAPQPCTTTWAMLTPAEIFLQNRGLAEVGCETPLAAAPLPTGEWVGSERGECRRLVHRNGQPLVGVIAPHIDRHLTGDRCDMATLSAWPEVPWGQLVGVADALRNARHPRIALGISRGHQLCPEGSAPKGPGAPPSAPGSAPASAALEAPATTP